MKHFFLPKIILAVIVLFSIVPLHGHYRIGCLGSLTLLRSVQKKVMTEYDKKKEPEFTQELFIAFTAVYQKVVEASVHYYLSIEKPSEPLQVIVTKIIIVGLYDIIRLLFSKVILLTKDSNLSWKEKLERCWWMVTMIMILKFGIEKMACLTYQTAD